MTSRLPLVSPVDRALFLKAQSYLEGVSGSVLATLASYTEERFYHGGDTIRSEGERIDRIIFLGQGVVETFLSRGTTQSRSRRIEAPGAIGLAHHFGGTEQTPGLRAISDALCLELRVDDLDQILEDHFSLLMQMSRNSCHQAFLVTQSLEEFRPPFAGFADGLGEHTPIQLDLVARLARLKQAPFWAETNLGVLAELVRREPPQMVREGERLWCEGEPIDRVAVVLDGQFRSSGCFGDVKAPSGSTLGAWELLLDRSRFEGWIAEAPSRVILIRRDLFIDLLEDHFEIAQTFLAKVNAYVLDGWDRIEARASSEETNLTGH